MGHADPFSKGHAEQRETRTVYAFGGWTVSPDRLITVSYLVVIGSGLKLRPRSRAMLIALATACYGAAVMGTSVPRGVGGHRIHEDPA